MSTQIKHSPLASSLLDRAVLLAVKQLEGAKVNADVLVELGHRIRGEVLEQVRRGEWAKLGVTEVDHMIDMRAKPRHGAWQEPPIVVDYDFARTKLPYLTIARHVCRGVRA